MGGALTVERQLRGSSFTNATARKWLTTEERGERETCKAEVHLTIQNNLK